MKRTFTCLWNRWSLLPSLTMLFTALLSLSALTAQAKLIHHSRHPHHRHQVRRHLNKQTDLRFSAVTVDGRYQQAEQAVAVVEDEKVTTDLVQVPRDFKDRLKRETQRR